jgi:hypothetical protein
VTLPRSGRYCTTLVKEAHPHDNSERLFPNLVEYLCNFRVIKVAQDPMYSTGGIPRASQSSQCTDD